MALTGIHGLQMQKPPAAALRGGWLERQEQVERVVRHLFEAIAIVETDC